MSRLVYVIGSLRNEAIPTLANRIETLTDENGTPLYDVFDDWHGSGPEADDEWQRWAMERGRTYHEALRGPLARNIYELDKRYLDACDIGVLVMPAGRSAHLELGYLVGLGKVAYVLFDATPKRYDVMYQFATDVFFDVDALLEALSCRYTYTDVT